MDRLRPRPRPRRPGYRLDQAPAGLRESTGTKRVPAPDIPQSSVDPSHPEKLRARTLGREWAHRHAAPAQLCSVQNALDDVVDRELFGPRAINRLLAAIDRKVWKDWRAQAELWQDLTFSNFRLPREETVVAFAEGAVSAMRL